jgi:uncharacterized protein YndB with AHSA1/START domain
MDAATGRKRSKVTLPTDEQILIERQFDAPKHLVYKAYTTPEMVTRWVHGGSSELVLAELDLRAGGSWRFVMITGTGIEARYHGEYRELVADQRVVMTEVFECLDDGTSDQAIATVNTATFTEADGRTSLRILMQAPSKASRDAIIASGMETGLDDVFDLLEHVAVSPDTRDRTEA